MGELIYNDSCLDVERRLAELSELYRPTLICGLYAPQSNEVALVRSAKAKESTELSLKFPQGGVEPTDQGIAETYERELSEEIGLDVGAIAAVNGLVLATMEIGGRPRSGKPAKAYGLLVGKVVGRPELSIRNPKEVSLVGWFDLDTAEDAFSTQASNAETADRGRRSLVVVDAIRTLFPKETQRHPTY